MAADLLNKGLPADQQVDIPTVQKVLNSWGQVCSMQKQGYPLEMRVARAFRHASRRVQQSQFSVDWESGQEREIDVVAHATEWC